MKWLMKGMVRGAMAACFGMVVGAIVAMTIAAGLTTAQWVEGVMGREMVVNIIFISAIASYILGFAGMSMGLKREVEE